MPTRPDDTQVLAVCVSAPSSAGVFADLVLALVAAARLEKETQLIE